MEETSADPISRVVCYFEISVYVFCHFVDCLLTLQCFITTDVSWILSIESRPASHNGGSLTNESKIAYE